MYSKEMMKALEADGEKLQAMTGEDHGPVFGTYEGVTVDRADLSKALAYISQQDNGWNSISTPDWFVRLAVAESVNLPYRDRERPGHMSELLELAERVEAGERSSDLISGIFRHVKSAYTASALANRSLDAAQKLHQVVMPGWYAEINIAPRGQTAVILRSELDTARGVADDPSAAWLSAILHAKAQTSD